MTRSLSRYGILAAALGSFLCGACSKAAFDPSEFDRRTIEDTSPVVPKPRVESFGKCKDFHEFRRPFFGDLHVHTSYSLDANLRGTRLNVRDAYRFARGEPVHIPPYDSDGKPSKKMQLDRPLDFLAVTDHSEFLGLIDLCEDPYSQAARRQGCIVYRQDPSAAFLLLNRHLSERGKRKLRRPRLCGPGGRKCKQAQVGVWADVQRAAEEAYDRKGCKFTSFVGYEWTASPRDVFFKKVMNHHRNVIFRTNVVPSRPEDYFDAPSPPELWNALGESCIASRGSCDVLAIPHNANLAAGTMYTYPPNGEIAELRADMEPLVEIYQHKGASECLPGTTAPDELCSFGQVPYDNLRGAEQGQFAEPSHKDFLRTAYQLGLRSQEQFGINAFQYGIIGSTDNHLALAGNTNEAQFVGGGGAGEEGLGPDRLPDKIYFEGGGLAVLWAEENSREALFRAMRRKETYGTSGTRITVRFFGGWELPRDWCVRPGANAIGYKRGVPMGSTLRAPPWEGATLRFGIRAARDPGTEEYPSSPLQRMQVIKGWLDHEGNYEVRVIDVAGDESKGADVDITSCKPSQEGFDALCTVWEDPAFDPQQLAYYYVRVVETPSCRWTTLHCNAASFNCESPTRMIDKQCCDPRLGLANVSECASVECEGRDKGDLCCQGPPVQPLVQERAWASPIWYVPEDNEPRGR